MNVCGGSIYKVLRLLLMIVNDSPLSLYQGYPNGNTVDSIVQRH